MTPPCVVPTFRPYTVENLEFGGFYASSCESRVNRAAYSDKCELPHTRDEIRHETGRMIRQATPTS